MRALEQPVHKLEIGVLFARLQDVWGAEIPRRVASGIDIVEKTGTVGQLQQNLTVVNHLIPRRIEGWLHHRLLAVVNPIKEISCGLQFLQVVQPGEDDIGKFSRFLNFTCDGDDKGDFAQDLGHDLLPNA